MNEKVFDKHRRNFSIQICSGINNKLNLVGDWDGFDMHLYKRKGGSQGIIILISIWSAMYK